jgi:hypothetical protein
MQGVGVAVGHPGISHGRDTMKEEHSRCMGSGRKASRQLVERCEIEIKGCATDTWHQPHRIVSFPPVKYIHIAV